MEFEKKNAKSINNLLSSPKTRIAGLHLLNSYLNNCLDNDILEYCIGWMQNCCKIDSSNKDRDFAVETLGKIIQLSANFPELNKSVSFFVSNRFSDYFFKYLTNSNFGWACTKLCFLYYRGSCGPSQEIFEKHLFNHITRNAKISREISQCFALLPSLGGCGKEKINYQINWKNQFLKFINITHLILNDLFVNVEELNEYGSADSSYQKNTDTEFLMIQFQNYCSVIEDMLLIKYPGPKLISTDLVLELICRGLAISPIILKKNERNIMSSFQKILPNIHIALLNILNALITTCKTQLLPYSLLICKLVKQTLSWSQSVFSNGSEKYLEILRISIYQVMCNWLIETKTGGCIDTISQFLIPQIISDVKSKKTVLLLKGNKSNSKSDIKNNEKCSNNFYSASIEVNYAALKTLKYFLKFYGFFLTMNDQKFLQETIIKLLVNIQNNFSSEILVPYSEPLCRKSLYSVLFELVQQPCSKWPPPTYFAFRIFKRGQNDKCPEISAFCSSALSITTNIIHQQYSNGPIINLDTSQNQDQNTELFSDILEKGNSSNELFFMPERNENACNSEDDNVESSSKQFQNIDNVPATEFENLENQNNNEELKQDSEIIDLSPVEKEPDKSPKGTDSNSESCVQEDTIIILNSEEGIENIDKSDKKEEDNTNNFNIKNSMKAEENNKQQFFSSEEIIEKVESHRKKPKIVEKESDTKASDKAPAVCVASQKIPEKVNKLEINLSEDSSSCHSVISEKRYFLRSKTFEGTSEEIKEIEKRTSSPDLVKNTPNRGLGKNTPKSVTHRPRTRALSKLEIDEKETEFSTPKKRKGLNNLQDEHRGNDDDDDDIIEVFDDTIIE